MGCFGYAAIAIVKLSNSSPGVDMADHAKRLGLLSRDGLASKEHFLRFSTHFPWMSKVLHPIYAEGHNRIGKPSIPAAITKSNGHTSISPPAMTRP